MFMAVKSASLTGAGTNSPHAAGWTGNTCIWLVACPTLGFPCQQHLYNFLLALQCARVVSRLRVAALLASAYLIQLT